MNARCNVWTLAVAMVFAGAGTGCSASRDGQASAEPTGTLSVALTGTTATGTSYHLTNAVFEIQNYYAEPPIDLTVSGSDPTLLVQLPPSISTFGLDYAITLQPGWTLNAVNADGSETPLGATLLDNDISFTIKPQRTTPITFDFKATEQVATTGNGAAGVSVAVDDTLIDDFEDGTGNIAPLGGRSGGWFTYNDGTGTETPAPGAPVLPTVIDTSANYLLRVTGTGFASEGSLLDGGYAFGAGVGVDLLTKATTVLPYDASSYSGVQFDAAILSATEPVILTVLVGTSATQPAEFGGSCTTGCYDDFELVRYFYPGSYLYTYSFTWGDLAQQGFGTPATFDPSTILSIKWQVAFPSNFFGSSSDNSFDLRLDNIAFLPGVTAGATGGFFDAGAVPIGPFDAGPVPVPVPGVAIVPGVTLSDAGADSGPAIGVWTHR